MSDILGNNEITQGPETELSVAEIFATMHQELALQEQGELAAKELESQAAEIRVGIINARAETLSKVANFIIKSSEDSSLRPRELYDASLEFREAGNSGLRSSERKLKLIRNFNALQIGEPIITQSESGRSDGIIASEPSVKLVSARYHHLNGVEYPELDALVELLVDAAKGPQRLISLKRSHLEESLIGEDKIQAYIDQMQFFFDREDQSRQGFDEKELKAYLMYCERFERLGIIFDTTNLVEEISKAEKLAARLRRGEKPISDRYKVRQ